MIRLLRQSLVAAAALLLPIALVRAGDAVQFIRGDANSDGVLSTADALTIQRFLFAEGPEPSCLDSADIDDSGRLDICDAFGVMVYLLSRGGCSHDGVPVDYGTAPQAPFPEPGEDPTPDTESYMSCNGFAVTPPAATDDTIRIGDVEVSAGGGEVEVPVFVGNSTPVEAVQLVLRYDPQVVRVVADEAPTITYAGTYYEQFRGTTISYQSEHEQGWYIYDEPYTFAHDFGDGFFAASIIPDILGRGNLQVPAGTETLVAKVRIEVSPDVPGGTSIHLDPLDGDSGNGYGPFHLRNELTYEGEGRYPTIVPRAIGGILRIGVDGDISFFIRGDSNGDDKVDERRHDLRQVSPRLAEEPEHVGNAARLERPRPEAVSARSLDLPIPSGPVKSTTEEAPARSRESAASIPASSAARPTVRSAGAPTARGRTPRPMARASASRSSRAEENLCLGDGSSAFVAMRSRSSVSRGPQPGISEGSFASPDARPVRR